MDLRAMLIEARGERRVGDMVHLRASEVDALIEALTPKPNTVVIDMNFPVSHEANDGAASRPAFVGYNHVVPDGAVVAAAKEATSAAVAKVAAVTKTRRSK